MHPATDVITCASLANSRLRVSHIKPMVQSLPCIQAHERPPQPLDAANAAPPPDQQGAPAAGVPAPARPRRRTRSVEDFSKLAPQFSAILEVDELNLSSALSRVMSRMQAPGAEPATAAAAPAGAAAAPV